MKTIYQFLTILLIQLVALTSYSQVCQDVTISSQADLDYLYCNVIGGDLIINDNNTGDIVDLESLFQVGVVEGDIIIENNPGLTTLFGLDGIESIGGNLIIQNNVNILDIGEDLVVSQIVGDLVVINNTNLENINTFNQLSSVGGKLEIKDQPNLTDINFPSLNSVDNSLELKVSSWTDLSFGMLDNVGGELLLLENVLSSYSTTSFDNLTTVDGNVTISSNQGISHLDGFSALTSASSVFILSNSNLSNIGGFNAVTDLIEMEIHDNDVLFSITGFGNLESVTGNFLIDDNGDITDLSGFPNLETVNEDFSISNNGGFSLNFAGGSSSNSAVSTPLDGFESLTIVGGDFLIENNAVFESITGFNNLESTNQFFISNNSLLNTIDGFTSLEITSNDLLIFDNSELQSIAGFTSLTTVGNTFRLDNNDACTSISGFDLLQSTQDQFNINDNDILSEINGFNSLTSVGGPFNITFNDGLTTIDGFDNLSSVLDFRLIANPVLTTVEGFQNISTIDELLQVSSNSSLSLCCWLAPVVNAIEDIEDIALSNNGPGCSSLSELGGGGPSIPCPSDVTVSTDAGQCSANFNYTDPDVTADCDIDNYVFTLINPDGSFVYQETGAISGSSFTDLLQQGTSTFQYQATDIFGNIDSCSYTVTVEDNEPPTWASGTTSLELLGECGDDPINILNNNMPTPLDNCLVTLSFEDSNIEGSCDGETIYTRVYEATDFSTDVQVFTVTLTLSDTTSPILSGLPADVTINCNDPLPTLPTITAFDTCDGDLSMDVSAPETIITTNDCVVGATSQTIQTAISVADACGNPALYIWNVTVVNDFVIDLGSDAIVCDDPSYTIDAGPGLTYLWSNGATTQSIDVTDSGNYEVTVTSANDCCSIDDINVDFITGLTATATGGIIDCTGNDVMINGFSSVTGVSFSWTGPGGFTSTLQNPSVSMTGDYTLTIQDSNGCTSTDVATVTPDTDVPDLSASGGLINCSNPSTTITSTSSEAAAFAWTGPNGFTADIADPVVSESGTYTILVTAPNGCTNSTSVTVDEDFSEPGVTADGGTLDCNNIAVTITATSDNTITNYAWTGPNGFASTQQVISAVDPGTYSVTTTGSNGCTSSTSAIVIQDTTPPTVTSEAGVLTCNNSVATITAESDDAVSFSWTGPNGFTSSLQNNSVSVSGLYTVVVTAANGCTESSTVEVLEDITQPIATATGGSIDCINTTTTINATSDDPNSTYLWSGPNNFSESGASVDTDVAGTYNVVVTASNGCTTSATAEVTSDVQTPSLSIEVGDVICSTSSIVINASTDPNAEVAWSGPNGFMAMGTTISVDTNGEYTAISTDNGNGCNTSQAISIDIDLSTPTATAIGGELSCNNSSVQLMGQSNSMSVTYLWTGQGGYSSILQNPIVDEAGTYTLMVTAMNGCSSTTTAVVTTDPDLPNATVEGGNIDCNNTEAQLTGTSTTPGAVGSWSGPNGFTSDDMMITVSEPGQYTYTVTGSNGCEATASFEVMEDTDTPDIAIVLGDVNCQEVGQDLSIESAEELITITWTTPSGDSSTSESILAIENGTYSASAVGNNGCTSTETIEVDNTVLIPEVSVDWIDLSCANPTTDLVATSNNGVSYEWSGPQGFTAVGNSTVTTQPGEYEVTVISEDGCSATETIMVTGDFTEPVVSLSTGDIDCANETISLTAVTDDNTMISWSGPGAFSGSDKTVVVDQAGTYTAIVTDTDNGCTTTETIFVNQDFSTPSASASGGQLSCTLTSIKLSGNSNTDNATFTWNGPGGFMSSEQNPTVEEPGEYILTVTSTNGCTNTAVAIVTTDPSVPNITISGEDISCINPTATLTGSTTTPGTSVQWTGPEGFQSDENTIATDIPGLYVFTVVGTNGCQSTSSFEVAEDIAIPELSIQNGGMVDCENGTQLILLNSDIDLASTSWTFPDGSVVTDQDIVCSLNGNYSVTAVGSNGCIATETFSLQFTFNYDVNIETTDATSSENGTATLQIIDGVATYEIEWDNGETGETAVDLTAGEHTVTVTDVNGCVEVFTFNVGLLSSTDEISDDISVNVYPNPVQDYLMIETSEQFINKVMVFNQIGQVVNSYDILESDTQVKVDLQSLIAGSYRVLLLGNSSYKSVNIIKAE